jgi:hypothetical protein
MREIVRIIARSDRPLTETTRVPRVCVFRREDNNANQLFTNRFTSRPASVYVGPYLSDESEMKSV